MTQLLNRGRSELLRLLARMPFLDRLELAALAGGSRGGTYQAVARLEEAGLVASFRHGSALQADRESNQVSLFGEAMAEIARPPLPDSAGSKSSPAYRARSAARSP